MRAIAISLAAVLAYATVPTVAAAQDDGAEEQREGSRSGNGRVEVTPYIEAAQVLTAELSPGDDVVTYTRLAAGVDAAGFDIP